jgi:hypothetical protein
VSCFSVHLAVANILIFQIIIINVITVLFRSLLLKIFNPLGQSVDTLHDLIKLLINEGALLLYKLLELVLGHTIIEIYGRSLVSGALFNMVSRKKKKHKKYCPYQLLGCGQGNKALNSQASYHGLTSVLANATGDAISSKL